MNNSTDSHRVVASLADVAECRSRKQKWTRKLDSQRDLLESWWHYQNIPQDNDQWRRSTHNTQFGQRRLPVTTATMLET